MRPEARKLVLDLFDAAIAIRSIVGERSYSDFRSNDEFQSAVLLKFVIVGEALHRLNATDEFIADQIGDRRRLIRFREQIVAAYGKFDHAISWNIVQRKLPALLDDLRTLLSTADDEASA